MSDETLDAEVARIGQRVRRWREERGLTLQELHGEDALEVGWHVRADLRGRGLATEAGHACLDWGMRETAWPRVISLVHVGNAPSAAVARKVHTGRLPDAIERRGGSHHVWFTDRLRS